MCVSGGAVACGFGRSAAEGGRVEQVGGLNECLSGAMSAYLCMCLSFYWIGRKEGM